MVVMDFETFAASSGASRQNIGDAALHMANKRGNTQKRLVRLQAKADVELIVKRGHLRKEYDRLVSIGEMRAPTVNEALLGTARGNDDLDSVQAARRICARRGIDWKTGLKIDA